MHCSSQRPATMKQLFAVVLLIGAGSALESSLLRDLLDKCPGDSDALSCLKLKAVRLLDRAFQVDSLPVLDFVSVDRNPSVKDDVRLPTAAALEATLPRDLDQKNTALDRILLDKLWSYLNSRTIKMDLPTDVFEGRQKMKLKKAGKKGGMYMMMFGAVGAMMLQLALGKLALIAGKALLISKVALLLAGVLGLKSLMSKGGHEETHTSQVIYAEPEVKGGWSRNSVLPEVAHDLAYWGQRSFRSREVSTTTSLPA